MKLLIFGLSDAAQLAHYYFCRDSDYEVVAFCTDEEFVPEPATFCGLPVVPFQNVASVFSPSDYFFFVAIGYSKQNRLRRDKYIAVKNLGYKMASYVSSRATVLNDNNIGENCFILEDNTIQPFVTIGNNVTLWSGNHIGHHSKIADHCFLASHVVVSGRVSIGEYCFIGVNATLRDNIVIAENCIIGAGTLILSNIAPDGLYVGQQAPRSAVPSSRVRKI